MLERRALHGHVNRLSTRRLELRLGLSDVEAGGEAAAEAVLRQLERLRVRGDRAVENLLIAVEPAQREVVDRELGLQAQARRLDVRRDRLGGGAGDLDRAV